MAATRYLTRSLFTATKQSFLTSIATRSYTTTTTVPSSSLLFRLRPLAAATCLKRVSSPVFSSARSFSTRQTTTSLNDSNPNWSNRPPKETILLDGCDFEHWLVVMEKPEGDPTREEIINSYIETLATVVGSSDEARMKIYSVSTRHYFAFGALVSEELSYKLKELPRVRWVLPDSYLDVRNKDYGGEPFINGEAVPYDPKYHEEWVRNNAQAKERNRRNDRPRNHDRSRNFERRRETPMNYQNPGPNPGPVQPNMQPQQPNMPPQQHTMHHQQPNMPPQQHTMHQQQPNYNRGTPPPNQGNYIPPNNMGPNNPQNYQYNSGPNYQPAPGPNHNYNQNVGPGYGPNAGSGEVQTPNHFSVNPGFGVPNQSGYAPNTRSPPGQNQGGGYSPNVGPGQNNYAPNAGGVNQYQNENVPGRDVPQPPRY